MRVQVSQARLRGRPGSAHMLCTCRLGDQDIQFGSAAALSDLPVERVMQDMKSQGGRMVTQAPEKHYAQWLCLSRHAEAFAKGDKSEGAHTAREQLEQMVTRNTDYTRPCFDSQGLDGLLVGQGTAVANATQEQKESALSAVKSLVYYYHELEHVHTWTGEGGGLPEALIHSVFTNTGTGTPQARVFIRAESPDEERYFSSAYGRARSRNSCWAMYKAEVTVGKGRNATVKESKYVAFIRFFLLLPSVNDGAVSTQEVRVAVADVYETREFEGGLLVVDFSVVKAQQIGKKERESDWKMWKDLGIPLKELKGKCCVAAPHGDRRGIMYFMPYTHFTDR